MIMHGRVDAGILQTFVTCEIELRIEEGTFPDQLNFIARGRIDLPLKPERSEDTVPAQKDPAAYKEAYQFRREMGRTDFGIAELMIDHGVELPVAREGT
jgi:hypothetical protein